MIGGYQDCEYLPFFLQCIIYTITSSGHTLGCYIFFSTFLFNHEMHVYFQLVEILDDHFIKGKNSLPLLQPIVSPGPQWEQKSLELNPLEGEMFAQWSVKCVLGYLGERSLCQGFHFMSCTLSRHFLEALYNVFGWRLLWLPTLGEKQALEGTGEGLNRQFLRAAMQIEPQSLMTHKIL